MADDSPREIKIGDQVYPIRRFKGLKAALAGALMSRVMREIPDLQDRATAFRKKYRESNTVLITPAIAKLPTYAGLGLTEADFRAAGGKIEFPEEPDQGTIMVNVFPDLFDLAQEELQKFLAIIVIPNSELEEADDADDVDEVLKKYGKRLMRQGDIDELLELVVIGLEVLKEQMGGKRDRLGKLQLPLLAWLLKEEEPEAQTTNGQLGETSPTPTETDQSQPQSSAQPSSIDSPVDSGGTGEPSYIESPGMS